MSFSYFFRKLQSLRNELDSLHDHVNKLQHPRVTMDMYGELRDHDEQLRRAHERRHERKLDELRQNIEQLKKDIKSKNRQDRRKPDWDTEFYDDFRSELRKVTDKLDELTALRNTSQRPLESSTAHAAPSETYSAYHPSQEEQMAERFGNLVRKVDELRLSVENRRDNFNPRRETSRYFCPLCHEAEIHHHGNRTVNTTHHQPQTSTPFAPDVHQQRKQTANLDHR
jgi:chromosome segregation ATPase